MIALPARPPTSRFAEVEARRRAGVVHVVDTDGEARQLLAELFLGAGVEALTYGSVDEFLERGAGQGPGCLLIDAGRTALRYDPALQARLRALALEMPVVIMAGHADVPMAVDAMKAGAIDFLEKPLREDVLLEAVHAAVRADLERRELRRALAQLRERFETLTPREREVMALVTAGRMNKQVAGDLGVSEITVKAHRGVVMRKMEARSIADLVRMGDAIPEVVELRQRSTPPRPPVARGDLPASLTWWTPPRGHAGREISPR